MAITVEYGKATDTYGRISVDGEGAYLFEGEEPLLRRCVNNWEIEYKLSGEDLLEKLLTEHRQYTWMRRIA